MAKRFIVASFVATIGLLLALTRADSEPALCTSLGNIGASMTPIDLPSFREDVAFTWVPPAYTSVFAMTTTGYVYFSANSGNTWTTQNVDTIMPQSEEHGVLDMYDTADPSKFVFLGGDGVIWLCTIGADGTPAYSLKDMTKVDSKHIGAIGSANPHPTKGDWLLLSTRSKGCITQTDSCYLSLFVTQDFGNSWHLLETYVRTFAWGSKTKGVDVSDESLFIVYFEDKTGNEGEKNSWYSVLGSSNDLWKSHSTHLSHVVGAWILGDTIFAPQLTASDGRSAQLMVSTDFGKSFMKTRLPSDMDEATKFFVLDTSEGAAFLSVDVSPSYLDIDYGNIYVSDSYDNEFSLSLAGNVRSGTVADFKNIGDIDGIYLANVYSPDTLEDPTDTPQILSRISFDKGGSWQPIPAPDGVPCWGNKTGTNHAPCALHLYNLATSPARQNWMVYSPPSTAGIVIANGNVGTGLAPPSNPSLGTFLSRDAGLSWELISNDTHVFKMADHGSLLVTASVPAPTQLVQFSWNQGLNFTTCAFTDMASGLRIKDIVKSPAVDSFSVLVYGTLPNGQYSGNAQGYLVYLDFSALVTNECRNPDSPDTPDSDYETFYPSDTRQGKCLLGQETVFVRKLRDVQCYNPSDFEVTREVKKCPCVREDYECDYCYMENPDVTGECIPDTTDPACVDYQPQSVRPVDCKGVWYPHSKGYRLVGGDKCDVEKGLNLLGASEPCTPSAGGSGSRSAVIAVIVVLVLLCGAAVGLFLVYRKNDKFRSFVDAKVSAIMAKVRGSSSADGNHYQMVGVINDDDPLGVIASSEAESAAPPIEEATTGGSLL